MVVGSLCSLLCVCVQEGIERLVKEMEAQEERHKKWSRHRATNPDKTVDYINDRNRCVSSFAVQRAW